MYYKHVCMHMYVCVQYVCTSLNPSGKRPCSFATIWATNTKWPSHTYIPIKRITNKAKKKISHAENIYKSNFKQTNHIYPITSFRVYMNV